MRTVKAFATEIEENKRFSSGNIDVYKFGYKKAMWYGYFNFVANLFIFGSMVAIIFVGSQLYKEGKITLGDITSFLLYMMQLLMNFMILASVLGSVMSVILILNIYRLLEPQKR